MKKTIKLTESRLGEIIRSKVFEAIRNKMAMMNESKDDYDYNEDFTEENNLSGKFPLPIGNDDYVFAFNEKYGVPEDKAMRLIDKYELPDDVNIRFSISKRESEGDYLTPSFTDYEITDWSIDDENLDRFSGKLMDVINAAVEYRMEDMTGEELRQYAEDDSFLNESRIRSIVAESIRRTLSNISGGKR